MEQGAQLGNAAPRLSLPVSVPVDQTPRNWRGNDRPSIIAFRVPSITEAMLSGPRWSPAVAAVARRS